MLLLLDERGIFFEWSGELLLGKFDSWFNRCFFGEDIWILSFIFDNLLFVDMLNVGIRLYFVKRCDYFVLDWKVILKL